LREIRSAIVLDFFIVARMDGMTCNEWAGRDGTATEVFTMKSYGFKLRLGIYESGALGSTWPADPVGLERF
jgi:hypothetical protein